MLTIQHYSVDFLCNCVVFINVALFQYAISEITI